MRSVARFIAAAAVAAAITLPMASSTLATVNGSSREAGVAFLQGVKTCSAPSTTPPQIVCRMTTSNVALLQGASVAYTSVPAILADPASDDSGRHWAELGERALYLLFLHWDGGLYLPQRHPRFGWVPRGPRDRNHRSERRHLLLHR
jgi:hypothetical protein